MSNLKIVSVINNFATFNRCIKDNENLKDFEVIYYDNTKENIGIPERYNSFIKTIKDDDDFWVAFIHQDFIFNENPLIKLSKLDKKSLYGAVGVARQLFYLQFKPNFLFRVNRRCTLGQIFEGEGERTVGNKVENNPIVKTFDCCCCVIHSSLIVEKQLKFDENLKFHMYVEDMCHSARKKGVFSRIVQMECLHLSGGVKNEEFRQSAQYVMEKHKIKLINSTCHI